MNLHCMYDAPRELDYSLKQEISAFLEKSTELLLLYVETKSKDILTIVSQIA